MENDRGTDMGTGTIREPIINKVNDWCYNILFKFDGRLQDNQKGEAIVELSTQSAAIFVHVERNGKQMRRKMKPCLQRDLLAAACVDAVKQPDLFIGTSLPS